MPDEIGILWGPLRSLLKENFTFREIKTLSGIAGAEVMRLAHIRQSSSGGAAKIDLIEELDSILAENNNEWRQRFLTALTEEILQCRPDLADRVDSYFSRLGWSFVEGKFLPITFLDASDIQEIPANAHEDILKAAARLRDGDFSGAISAACGAVDSVTERIYEEKGLGDPGGASFQEKVVRCLNELGVLSSMESDLIDLVWNTDDAQRLRNNLRGAVNQAAYVMQTLRSNMGDVHGTKPTLKPIVFDSIKWAMLITALLKEA